MSEETAQPSNDDSEGPNPVPAANEAEGTGSTPPEQPQPEAEATTEVDQSIGETEEATASPSNDDVNDAGGYTPESELADEPGELTVFNASRAAHRVMVQLKRVENEIRAILEDRDSKRKRKLGGTARWQELEDDINEWQFTGRFDQSSLRRLRELIFRRHSLFDRLKFLSGTRPTWNS